MMWRGVGQVVQDLDVVFPKLVALPLHPIRIRGLDPPVVTHRTECAVWNTMLAHGHPHESSALLLTC